VRKGSVKEQVIISSLRPLAAVAAIGRSEKNRARNFMAGLDKGFG
jgi:hypothetical protein